MWTTFLVSSKAFQRAFYVKSKGHRWLLKTWQSLESQIIHMVDPWMIDQIVLSFQNLRGVIFSFTSVLLYLL